MNSYALALMLGGLRGPLVMMLWTSSETQKQDKNLEDFDTKVELIRLLQPEFDSVHIFQVWNKDQSGVLTLVELRSGIERDLPASRGSFGAPRGRSAPPSGPTQRSNTNSPPQQPEFNQQPWRPF